MMPGAEERLRRQSGPKEYRTLRLRVLERDGWRCQSCGRRDQLEIHHQVRRSQLGPDHEDNLIVLCAGCHGEEHEHD